MIRARSARLLGACTVIAVVSSVGACGGEVHRAEQAIPETEFSHRRAVAECELHRRCCQRVGLDLDEVDCVDYVRGSHADRMPLPDTGSRYNPSAAAACIAALDDFDCPIWKEAARWFPASCLEVYERGHVPVGGLCNSISDCAEGPDHKTTCGVARIEPETVIRTCKKWIERHEGESCESDDPDLMVWCVQPLLCDDIRRVCVRPARRGETCLTGLSWGDTCEAGSVCDRRNTKRCVAPVPVGGACRELEQCEDLRCINGICREPVAAVWSMCSRGPIE